MTDYGPGPCDTCGEDIEAHTKAQLRYCIALGEESENESDASAQTQVQRWVDPAMYAAEPVPTGGPRVYLLEATPDPLGSIAATAALYEGAVRRSKAEVTYEERQKYLRELQKTKIKAPLEFVQFHFLCEGVTRGFTHQLVRQRTATFVQESTRFAVKEDMPVGLPPSLGGMTEEMLGMTLPDNQVGRWAGAWHGAMETVREAYEYCVNSGMPAEDARGMLPTNLLTRVHYSTDLRALLDHAGNRLCTQAQFEWRIVFAKMAEAIRYYPIDMGGEMMAERWQWEAIAALLQPVCYQLGKCAFDSSMDRQCSIRERVQKFASIGMPSSEWHKPVPEDHQYGPPIPVDGLGLAPIQPAEWLADPGAAR